MLANRKYRWVLGACLALALHIGLVVVLSRVEPPSRKYSVKISIVDLREVEKKPEANSPVVSPPAPAPVTDKKMVDQKQPSSAAPKRVSSESTPPQPSRGGEPLPSSGSADAATFHQKVQLIERTLVPPEYTDAAMDAGYEGVIEVRVLVNELGEVTEVEPLSAIKYGMQRSILRASWSAQFLPEKNASGEPQAIWYTLRFNLKLR